MVVYHINELYTGLKIIQNREPCIIISNECVKPGKGQSFNRVRFKQIRTGKFLEKTFKPGDCLESANVVETRLIYVYQDGDFWFFMDEKNFEQIAVSIKIIGDNSKWMVNQLQYIVTFWDQRPILVTPPNHIELKIIKTDDFFSKNIISSSGTKLATVSTGAVIKVPVFVQSGDVVKVDTRSGMYISRINK